MEHPTQTTGIIMTNLLSSIKSADHVEEVVDVLGGGDYSTLESGVYDATIKYAYLSESQHGAIGLHVEFETSDKQTFKESFYVTNRQKENFYVDKNDSTKKHLLPGYITAEALSLFTTQKPLSDLKTETSVIKLYDYDAKKNLPTEVDMLSSMLDKPIRIGVHKVIENKKTKNDKGEYVDTNESRELNQVNAVFHPKSNLTVSEIRSNLTEPKFHEAWSTKWTGVTYDKFKEVKGGSSKTTNPVKEQVSDLFD